MKRSGDNTAFWVSGAAFALFSAVAGAGLLYGLDVALMLAIQSRTWPLLDHVGNLFSAAGGWELTGVVLLALVAGLYRNGKKRLAVRLLIAFVATGVLEYAMKMLLPVPPIPDGFGRTEDFTPTIDIEYPFPYPSGHVLRATIVLGAAYLLTRSRLVLAGSALFLAAMAASRLYLGVHWASDMVGAALLGIAALAWAFKRKEP